MKGPFKVWKDVYLVGSFDVTHPADCSIYLVNCIDRLALIDTGAGLSFAKIVSNIELLGFDPQNLNTVILTHAHIDHIGSAWQFRQKYNARIIAHELDAAAIESGAGTGAEQYGVDYHPCTVDTKLNKTETPEKFGPYEFHFLHIPGHTPGSAAVYVDMEKRVLFGQDIHGPYFLSGADPALAKESLGKLLALEADILCEGHFGIIQPKKAVKEYIEGYLRRM
jgi:glyoxylase-like metal-dependent hydrolase (beta-lactamase superfamily II)